MGSKAGIGWLSLLLLVGGIGLPVLAAAQDEPAQSAAGEKDKDQKDEKEKAPDSEKDRLQVYDEIEVTGRASDMLGIADSASEGVTGREDLARRPILRPGELLETVPGVIITQHSGGGKANQYFLRGFNLDHGTDFRITVDGIQVNLPSHGHGQGYSDLNFLIPELVDSVRYQKGSYAADQGDFSSAGAAEIRYVDALPEGGLVQATPGSFGYGRLLAADSTPWGGGEILGALEYSHNDGPWERPDGFHKLNGLARWSRGDAADGLTLTFMGYDGGWASTDQIPRRAVQEGRLSRFGQVDPTDGGNSSRYSLSAERRYGDERSLTRLSAYFLRYDLNLYSNFTYFLDDPVDGDQFEQTDRRNALGLAAERQWGSVIGGRSVEWSAGVQMRGDDIRNGLFHTRERVRLARTREDDILIWNGGPYVQGRVRWTPWLRTVTGLRADAFFADVESDLAVNSGREDDFLLSPKLSVLLGPWRETEVYLNYGYGFHSNDARGATITVDPRTGEPVRRVDPLVRARSADFGVRTAVVPHLQLAVTAFALDLDSELVFIGDAGGTEASRPSRRTGVEIQSFYRPLPWLSIDADLALSRGRFTDSDPAGDFIPGAIEEAVAAGISIDDLGPVFGSLRVRHFGSRPLIEDDSVRSEPTTLVNGRLGYAFPQGLRVALEVFNLLDEKANDIEYFYESRLPGETEPVEDVHFHPAEPRAFRVVAEWRFGGR